MRRLLGSLKRVSRNLTIFDYLSVALAIGVILMMGFFFLRKWEWVEIEVKVASENIYRREEKPPYWLAENIEVGDYELEGLGRKMVEVLDTRIFEREGQTRDIYLRLKVQAVKDQKRQQYLFKSKPLGVGSPIELRLSQVFLSGLVTYVEGMPDNRVWEEKTIEARTFNRSEIFPETLGVMPWIAEAIEVGDKMEDGQGRVIAEILDKKIRPAEKIVVTSNGKVLIQPDPIKKDLFLILKLKTVKQGGVNYFLDDVKVKVDTPIPLCFTNIDLLPLVTKILD